VFTTKISDMAKVTSYRGGYIWNGKKRMRILVIPAFSTTHIILYITHPLIIVRRVEFDKHGNV
jgi:hypothetical protein